MRVQPKEPELLEPLEEANPWRTLVFVAAGLAILAVRWPSTMVVILALVVFIFLHELGHYVTAKWAGMKVTEFFIGFGPRLWSFTKGETEYGLKAIPAGAYVRIIGMSNLENDVDPADEDRTYRSKSYARRMSVAVAGSTMHFIVAFILIVAVFGGFGIRNAESSSWTVYSVLEPSAAASAGVQVDDRILAVDGVAFASFDAMSEYLRERPGETVELRVLRAGEVLTLRAELGRRNPNTGEAVGFLGIGPTFPLEREGPIGAVVEGGKEMFEAGKASILGLGRIFSPAGVSSYVDQLTGPPSGGVAGEPPADRPTSVVGIVQIGSQVAESGWVNVFYLMFAVNIFIGIFNLIPLLPFDGGHVAIATYEKIRSLRTGRRYHADVAKLLPLTYVVVLLLAALFVTTIYLDFAQPISVR